MKQKVIVIISIMLLGLVTASGYFIYKKKDNEGFCWAKMKRLSDDELYQAAMMNWISKLQKEQKKFSSKFDFCDYAENCKIWMIKEPLSISQIKQKMELSWNKPMSEIIKIFEMQNVDKDFMLEHLQQNNNGYTLVHNERK